MPSFSPIKAHFSRLHKLGWILVWVVAGLAQHLQARDGEYVSLRYFGDELVLPAMPELYQPIALPLSEQSFTEAYQRFERSEYHPFLKKIGDYRRGMNLGDWHFYDLVARYSEQVFPVGGRNFQVLFQWFVLRKSGLDVRLFFTETAVYLNARSEDIEFGFYIMQMGGAKYANLTAKRDGIKLDNLEASMPNALMDSATMPFSMRLTQLPRITSPDTIERLIEFQHKGQKIQLRVMLNEAWLELMDIYPYFNQRNYFEIGMSREAENSLLPQLTRLMEGKTDVERVEFLLSFTRTAFFYKDDNWRYGKEKPMTPEETLYHSYSDCEDRSALFFYLNRKLLRFPAIVLDYESHVGVALELPGVEGDFYKYKNRKFVYCEPTGPQDLLRPGEMWPLVRGQQARIITDYFPQ